MFGIEAIWKGQSYRINSFHILTLSYNSRRKLIILKLTSVNNLIASSVDGFDYIT